MSETDREAEKTTGEAPILHREAAARSPRCCRLCPAAPITTATADRLGVSAVCRVRACPAQVPNAPGTDGADGLRW